MDALLTLTEIKAKARHKRAKVIATVILADDTIAKVEAGPRGGWKVLYAFDKAARSCVVPYDQAAQDRVMLAGYVGRCVGSP
jgi:hypothetical protein